MEDKINELIERMTEICDSTSVIDNAMEIPGGFKYLLFEQIRELLIFLANLDGYITAEEEDFIYPILSNSDLWTGVDLEALYDQVDNPPDDMQKFTSRYIVQEAIEKPDEYIKNFAQKLPKFLELLSLLYIALDNVMSSLNVDTEIIDALIKVKKISLNKTDVTLLFRLDFKLMDCLYSAYIEEFPQDIAAKKRHYYAYRSVLKAVITDRVNNYPRDRSTQKTESPAQPTAAAVVEKPEEKNPSLQGYLDELNQLTGLETVKLDVTSLIHMLQIKKIREERGFKQEPMSLHLVFSGNPGTGKTTVARLLANIYHELGVLSKGHLVEVDRSGLVAAYVGQTALKVKEVLDQAKGGILFIDEAYSLVASDSPNDYGPEAIDTLLKGMEDNRNDLIVIVAGYPDLMKKFLSSNPGLYSRFNKFIDFPDYTPDELYQIFLLQCSKNNLTVSSRARFYIRTYFKEQYEKRDRNFANGRMVRNFFETMMIKQANRLAMLNRISDEALNTIEYEDIEPLLHA